MIRFFLDTLNGNFFKLKNLISFLDETISAVSRLSRDESTIDTASSVKSVDNNNSLQSLKNLIEINKFLTLPCTHSLFKAAIKKHNRALAKSHVILTDINANVSSSGNDEHNSIIDSNMTHMAL
jgi:hypothetical protein